MAFSVTQKQSKAFGTGSPGAFTAFTPANNSVLVVAIHCLQTSLGAGTPTYTISDNLGGTWTSRVSSVTGGSFGTIVYVFTRDVTTGASTTVTVTLAGGNTHDDGTSNTADIFEVTGQDTVGSWLGLTASDQSASSGGHSLSLGGTTAASSLVLGFVTADGDYGAPLVDVGSGYTAVYKTQNGTSGWCRATAQYKVGAESSVPFGDVTYAYTDAYAAMEIKAAAGGGGVTLSASGGSYSLSGTAATIKVARKAVAGAGSYAITGTVVTIRKNKPLAAAAGSYSITGTAAGVQRGRKTVAAAGSYAVTGSAATLRKNKPLAAASGSYAITGTAATLRKNKPLVAAAGSYAITGSAAAVRHGWQVIAAAGSYSLAGTDASLTKSSTAKTVAAGSGAYSLSGSAASVLHGWKVPAGAGAYAISGSTASVRHAWKLPAVTGTYVVTGSAATVRHGWKIAAASGGYVLTGTAANLTKLSTKTLLADSGSYAISGTAANLKFARRVIAGSGSYSIAGGAASIARGRRVLAGGGAYSVNGQDAAIVKGQRRLSGQAGSYLITGSSAELTRFNPDGPRTDPTRRRVGRNVSLSQRPSASSSGTRPEANSERRRNSG